MNKLFTDGKDIVVAESAEDANIIWEFSIGSVRVPGQDAPWAPLQSTELIKLEFGEWGNLPDVSSIQIPDSAYVEAVPGAFHVTATAKAWAEANKPGILSMVEQQEKANEDNWYDGLW